MPKQPEEKLPKKEADKRRDEALRRMGKTPPKPHKSDTRRAKPRTAGTDG